MNLRFLKFTIAIATSVFCSIQGLQAQDLTGIWRGYFHTSDGYEYKFEIQVEQTKNNRITGVSYSYLDTRFYGKATMTGNFNKSSKTALMQEIKTVEVKMAGGSTACIMKFNFTYSKSGREEFLEGVFTSVYETDVSESIKRGDPCGPGTVALRRVTTSDFYIEPFLRKKLEPKKDTVAKAPAVKVPPKPSVSNKPKTQSPPVTKPNSKPTTSVGNTKTDTIKKSNPVVIEKPKEKPKPITPPAVTRSRENELVKTFTVHDDEVTVRFYDNGDIDDDTISVYLDGKPLVMNQRLSTNPITIKVKMDENNPEHTLVMVAENLGKIPPNTSLMIVQDGDNRYQASITSTEQKNAMVRFRYQKK